MKQCENCPWNRSYKTVDLLSLFKTAPFQCTGKYSAQLQNGLAYKKSVYRIWPWQATGKKYQ
jgi:hypothetical protein